MTVSSSPLAENSVPTKKASKRKGTLSNDVDDVQSLEESGKHRKKRRKTKDAEANSEPSIALDLEQNGALDRRSAKSEKEITSKTKRRNKEISLGDVDPHPIQPALPSSTDEQSMLSEKAKKRLKKEAKRLAKVQAEMNMSSEINSETILPSPVQVQNYLAANAVTIHSSESTGPIAPILTFDQLSLPDQLRQPLKGFKEPTPIQACTWPALIAKLDVIGIAETGSGKTLAFGIPALLSVLAATKLSLKEPKAHGKVKPLKIRVLVIAPTRELAIQTHETLLMLGEPFGIRSACVFGGVGKGGQIQELRDPSTQILVGTPGRLLDLANEGICNLSNVTYLVLDEADRMLDKGFENDVRRIIEMTSKASERQTVMFSATWPDSVRKLADTFLRNPIRIVVGNDELTANKRVTQEVKVLEDSRLKDGQLSGLLRAILGGRGGSRDAVNLILVFVLYKKEASRVESNIRRQGYSVAGLHGDLSQEQRIQALNGFKEGRTRILVATDVAARGLDIPDVSVVINYSFPLTIEDYIHRIGRTGRGGKEGESITFFTGENHERTLAGELARVLRESGFDAEPLKKFPMTVKKKEHSAYGAFYRDDVAPSAAPQKIKF